MHRKWERIGHIPFETRTITSGYKHTPRAGFLKLYFDSTLCTVPSSHYFLQECDTGTLLQTNKPPLIIHKHPRKLHLKVNEVAELPPATFF